MERAVLIYDGDCGFCRWSMAKILAWDRPGRIRPLRVQDSEADQYLDGMSEEEKMASWHLVTPYGSLYSAGEAVPHLMKLLPAGAPIGALARTFPGVTDRAYQWVARNRDRLGRRLGPEACSVDPASRGRHTAASGGAEAGD